MPSRSPLRLPALIVALGIAAAAVSGCASTDQSPREVAANAFTDLRREINAQVADPARRTELLTLTDEFERLLDEAAASRSDTEARIRALNADYDSTEAEFVARHGARHVPFSAWHCMARAVHQSVVQAPSPPKAAAASGSRSIHVPQ